MLAIRADAKAASRLVLLALVLAIMLPSLAAAQSIAGVVRDASGAVLPGVTVEAASPALIEKVRTAVSDGAGQYRLENLAPGTYKVTYSLPGFATVERDGVQVSTGVTVTLNADMRVGGVQETITVTGETPVVDVQNSTRVQQVLSDEVLAALPASRGYGNLLATVSGIQANGIQNGGINPGDDLLHVARRPQQRGHRADRRHERRLGVQRRRRGGLRLRHRQRPGSAAHRGRAASARPTAAARSSTSSPRRAATRSAGPTSAAWPGHGRRATTSTTTLKSFGIPGADQDHQELGHQLLDGRARSSGTGCGSTRSRARFGEYTDIAGRFGNLNAGNPTRWNYVVDPSIKSRSASSRKIVGGARDRRSCRSGTRSAATSTTSTSATAARTPRTPSQCRVRGDDWIAVYGFGTWSPESTPVARQGAEHIMQFSYTAPVTNKLLLEAAASQFFSNWSPTAPAGALDQAPFIPVQERSLAGGVPVPNMVYHGYAGLNNNHQTHNVWRASLVVRHRRAQHEGRLSGAPTK